MLDGEATTLIFYPAIAESLCIVSSLDQDLFRTQHQTDHEDIYISQPFSKIPLRRECKKEDP
jgi:hypothetical protein